MSFDALYSDYSSYVSAIIARRIPAAEVEDLAQEVWLRAFAALQSGSIPDDPKPWLANTARTVCRDFHRHKQPMISIDAPVQSSDDEGPGSLADTLADVSEPSIDPAVADAMKTAVDRLTPALREVVERHYYLGERIEDIAFALGIPVGTVKRRLHDARIAMRQMLLPSEQKKVA